MFGRQFGATLLVAGTSIGAGMLALPMITASLGFFGAFIVLVMVWSAMLIAALFMLEVNLSLPSGANLVSMANLAFGKIGCYLVWILYLGLLYALNAAYLDGFLGFLQVHFSNFHLVGMVFLLLFMGLLVFGTRAVDNLNRVLVLGLCIIYLVIIFRMFSSVNVAYLQRFSLQSPLQALPVIITAFGFQILIPTIRNYCQEDVGMMLRSIVHGSVIALVVYLFWQLGVFGMLPLHGAHSLSAIKDSLDPVVSLSANLFSSHYFHIALELFAVFAIATSFLGVSVSLFDFFVDAWSLKKQSLISCLVLAVIFTPSLVCLFYFPHIFVVALSYGGVFVALLLGLLPVFMSYSLRKSNKSIGIWQVLYAGFAMIWVVVIMACVLLGAFLY